MNVTRDTSFFYVSIKPDNLAVVAELINAYSKFDPEKAAVVSSRLPTLEELTADLGTVEKIILALLLIIFEKNIPTTLKTLKTLKVGRNNRLTKRSLRESKKPKQK